MFDPVKLKDDFMRDESRTVTDPISSRGSPKPTITRSRRWRDTIKCDPKYCTRERTDAIRADLRRYLAGDYSPTAKLARWRALGVD